VQETRPFWQKRGVDISDYDLLKRVADDLKTRSKTLAELADASLFYFTDDIVYDREAADKYLNKEIVDHLTAIAERLPTLQDFTKKGMENFLRAIAGERGVSLKVIAQPLRVALTGKTVSPGVDEVMVTLGKERVIKRIRKAIVFINSRS
jgi:glutamyl-tRNA synthetase